MNLFERIQYKLNEEPTDNKDQSKKSSRNKKKFSKNISNTVKVSKDTEGLGNRQGRQDATNPKKGGYPRVEDNLDDKPSGKTKLSNTTKGGPVKVTKTKVVKQSEVSKNAQKFTKKINKKRATVANYPKTREQLVSKRAEYGIDTQGKATKAGIEKFARRRKQSNLPLTKKDISAAKKSMVGTGRKGADVGKYGGKLSKQRYVSDTTFKKVQKKINIKNPVKTSPVTGGPIPLKGKELKDYKQQQQQQQQPQQGSSTTTKPKPKPNNTRNTQNLNQQELKKKLEQIKKNLKNPTDKSFGDALKNNQTGIKTPPPNELEKIKPKVTTSIDTQKKLGKLSQTKLGNPSSMTKLSKHLMKNKNKYSVAAGLALAGGAYLLGRNRVAAAKTKEKKAVAAFNKKEAQKPKEMVDVQLFLNRTGTPPKKSTKFNSVYDKNYTKNLKSKNTTPKTTTPKNNPVSKYTSGVSNSAKTNAALPFDSNKIASYAKPSQRSSKK